MRTFTSGIAFRLIVQVRRHHVYNGVYNTFNAWIDGPIRALMTSRPSSRVRFDEESIRSAAAERAARLKRENEEIVRLVDRSFNYLYSYL